jgi:hypothetical protein
MMGAVQLTLLVLDGIFAVCKLDPNVQIPEQDFQNFFSVTRTPKEISIVCLSAFVPNGAQCSEDWRCFQIEGVFDFSTTGILSSVLEPLAKANIGIFAISTYDTDYILVKQNDLEKATQVLSNEGHRILL